ncbi:MAG TPA: DNA polymerase domain-containing protein [Anaerolineales bacterium]|nr:DNA polymerase domain-containing protein [Anaerolineales bacterium]
MAELCGWLFDLYADPQDGLVLWLLEEGEHTTPRRLTQSFPVTFYTAGETGCLRQAWRYLRSQSIPLKLSRTERRDLFQAEPVTALTVEVSDTYAQPRLFAQLAHQFPDLTYYDADLHVALRHAARHGTFPLARLRVEVDARQSIQAIEVLDTPWELEPQRPPLRVMALEPDYDPNHATPTTLLVRYERWQYRFSLDPPRPLLINLAALLRRHDPDLLLTAWGDTWLLPRLLALSRQTRIRLPLNRDPGRGVLRKRQRSYQAHGQVVYRGGQVQLFGRWHLDVHNTVMFHDYGLEGVLESARVSGLPVQQAARLSPGTGISAMQTVTALRQGVLVPWRKPQAELDKSALDLLRADQGGLVYQPIPGLHRNVAEIDFISMYPSIMRRFNISPETVSVQAKEGYLQIPEVAVWVKPEPPGLIPQTLAPLLDKRIALKRRLVELPGWHPQKQTYKAQASAHKWLLVTCFGYLGYQNARFGRIEAHQAVTACSRECLLRAKEAIEDAGGAVLHLYVDGLWAQIPGKADPQDFQPLLDEITLRTGLPIALDGIYRWVAFLPARTKGRSSVANRYFGVFQDGSIKVRGIEARRRDTPPFIAQVQMKLLEKLAQVDDVEEIPDYLPSLLGYLRQQVAALRARQVPLTDLLVRQSLSRELSRYRSPSPAARAAAQLEKFGKHLRPGQSVRFWYTLGEPGVWAWGRPDTPSLVSINAARYIELLLRAATTIFQPFGWSKSTLKETVLFQAHSSGLFSVSH